MEELISRQRQIVFNLQEECLQDSEDRFLEERLREAIDGLDILIKVRAPIAQASLPVNQPMTYGNTVGGPVTYGGLGGK